MYCLETITKCNTARSSQTDFANDQRKRLKDAFLADIQRVKKKINDVHRKRDNSEEKYNETALGSTAQLQHLGPWQNNERVRIHAALCSSYDAYAWTVQRLATQEHSLGEVYQSHHYFRKLWF